MWLIIIGAVFVYLWYKNQNNSGERGDTNNIGELERIASYDKSRLLNLEHFDSPHFIDLLNDSDVMEVNYMRLKQRYIHDKVKSLEIAKDWQKYVEALDDLKLARTILDVGEVDDFIEDSKEPSIIKEEIEKRFKTLLGKEWQKLMPDYFERTKKANEAMKKEADRIDVHNAWRVLYLGESNLEKMEKLRKAQKEEDHAK